MNVTGRLYSAVSISYFGAVKNEMEVRTATTN